MKVCIDSREKSRIKPAMEYFTKKGLECEVKQLKSNDYIFTDGNKTVGFEFKDISDFVSSISNGKVFRQVVESDADFTFIILHRYNDLSNALFKYNYFASNRMYDVNGVIGRLNLLCDGVWIENSPVLSKSFNKMIVQAEKCFSLKEYGKTEDLKKMDNPCINFLNSIKGINLKTSKLIVDELKLNCLHDLLKVSDEDLLSIKGIGKSKMKLIGKSIWGGHS